MKFIVSPGDLSICIGSRAEPTVTLATDDRDPVVVPYLAAAPEGVCWGNHPWAASKVAIAATKYPPLRIPVLPVLQHGSELSVRKPTTLKPRPRFNRFRCILRHPPPGSLRNAALRLPWPYQRIALAYRTLDRRAALDGEGGPPHGLGDGPPHRVQNRSCGRVWVPELAGKSGRLGPGSVSRSPCIRCGVSARHAG